MKIHKQEATFQPITIVLESQEEVDQMFALANYNRFESKQGLDITIVLYEQLEEFTGNYLSPIEREDDSLIVTLR